MDWLNLLRKTVSTLLTALSRSLLKERLRLLYFSSSASVELLKVFSRPQPLMYEESDLDSRIDSANQGWR